MNHIKALAGTMLLSIAALSFGQGIYYWGKAELAQWLLLRAWGSTQLTGAAHKPWPWADIQPAALLEIPRLKVQQVALEQQHGEALAFGPGMIEENGAYVLAGHRDSHFQFLQHIKLRDRIRLTTNHKEPEEFYISDTQVIDSRKHSHFTPPSGALILVSCYPFDALGNDSPLRYVAVAYPNEPPLSF